MKTGIKALDYVIQQAKSLLIYGEAGSGKTTLALQIAKHVVEERAANVLYVTDGDFPSERALEILGLRALTENVLVLEIGNFRDFLRLANEADQLMGKTHVQLMIVDTVSRLYQLFTSQLFQENVIRSRLLNMSLARLKTSLNMLNVELIGISGVVLSNTPVCRKSVLPHFDVVLEMRNVDADFKEILLVKPPLRLKTRVLLSAKGVTEHSATSF